MVSFIFILVKRKYHAEAVNCVLKKLFGTFLKCLIFPYILSPV